MKPAKFLKFIALVLVILLIVLSAAFYFFGEYILKTGIESAATKTLGVVVSIDQIDLAIIRGKVGIKNIIVKNPPGYNHPNLLELSEAHLTASIGSLLSDTVRIRELKLDGISLVIEQKALSNNLQDVIKSLSPKDKSQTRPKGKKLHIDELEITNVQVKAKLLPVPGKADTVTMKLPPIKMTNLGTDNKLNTGILVNEIMFAITAGIAEKGTGILPKEVVGTMKTTLEKTIDLGKTATQEGEKLLDKGKDVGTEIIEGFEGLLRPKKDK